MMRYLYLTILILLTTSSLFAQTIQPEKRIALVIGNGNYNAGLPLANPENDARSMTDVLQTLGFTVFKYENLNQSQMKRAVSDFGARLKGNDVGLFYYAGHGIQANGFNYLIPVDATLKSEEEVDFYCVRADMILASMETSGTKINVLILDACRNNPFERSWTRSATGRGLAFMSAPTGTLIAYATSPGKTASDGSGKNGLYTSAILESITIPNLKIEDMFKNVRNTVITKSQKQQMPWESTSLTGNFYFNSGGNANSELQKEIQVTPINEISTSLYEGDYIIDSRDNERYKTVKIGTQTWMAENLRTTKFIDGTDIQLIIDNSMWKRTRNPGYCWFINDKRTYSAIYGALYNWYAVNSGELCPIGWHIPSDAEWTALTTYLGGLDSAGGKLKEIGIRHWNSPNKGATDIYGFKALPGSHRDQNGKFMLIGYFGCWWSSTENSEGSAWSRAIFNSSYKVKRHLPIIKQIGCSVRCIKD